MPQQPADAGTASLPAGGGCSLLRRPGEVPPAEQQAPLTRSRHPKRRAQPSSSPSSSSPRGVSPCCSSRQADRLATRQASPVRRRGPAARAHGRCPSSFASGSCTAAGAAGAGRPRASSLITDGEAAAGATRRKFLAGGAAAGSPSSSSSLEGEDAAWVSNCAT